MAEESSVPASTSNDSFESNRLLRFIFVMTGSYSLDGWRRSYGRAGRWPTVLYSRRSAAPQAGVAVSAFGDDHSRG
ncbi:MAG TPA: hypothetical protein DIC56_01940 [Rhizobium sp.]|nr:hypothetical protein [Rhizobium sp.]